MDLWDIVQHYQIKGARDESRNAAERASRHESKIANGNDRIERLMLATQAMWELVREHTGLGDEHLLAKMAEIDSRDGMIDEKIGAETIDCPHCGRKTNTRSGACFYCGKPVRDSHVFAS
jgi:hypothetical protein